jgi:AcrR family transcriptional regulator
MHIPTRTLRAWVEDAHGRPPPSVRELDREDTILKKASTLFLRAGRHGVSLTGLSQALRMAPFTVRMAFCDLDNILFEILWRYLTKLRDAVAAVPEDMSGTMPGHTEARVLAYLEIARCGLGGLSENHILLTRERHGLPPDLAEPLEALRHQIGELIAGSHSAIVLAMLDTPYAGLDILFPMLRALFATGTEANSANTPATTLALPKPAAPPAETPDLPKPSHPAHRDDIPEAAKGFTLSGRRPIDLSGPPLGEDKIEDFLRQCEADELKIKQAARPKPS